MNKLSKLLIIVIILILIFITMVYSQNEVPIINGRISSSDSVNVGESITFYGDCQGANSALVVCKDNNICNLNSEFVRCKSDFTNDNQKSCSYQATDLDIGLNDNDIGTCCNSENICDTNTVSVESWKAKRVIEKNVTISEDLSSFPNFLRLRKEGNNVIPMNTTIVIGKNAPSEDVVSAVELINGLAKPLNNRIFSSLDSDITNEILVQDNLIIIGNSSINQYMIEFSSEEQNIPYYVAKIKLINNEKNRIIYIIGKNSFYRRKAALALANYQNYNLLGSEVCITGNNYNIDDIEIVDCNNIQNVQDPALRQQSLEGQIGIIQAEYIPEILVTEKILLNKAECYDYEKKNFDCSNELKNEDKNTVNLITSKGKDSYAEIEFYINNSDKDGVLFLNLVFKSYNKFYQTVPMYYHDRDLLKNICIISPNNDGVIETQNCEIKNYRNNSIRIRIEGVSFKGDIRLEIDSVTLNHTYSKESLIAKTYSRIINNIKGSMYPGKPKEITLNGECAGENTKLLVCNYGVACNLDYLENILCESEFTNNSIKECTYLANESNINIEDNYIGTCCNINKICDTTTVNLNQYSLKPIDNETIYETYKGKRHLMNFASFYPGENSFSVEVWIKVEYAHDGVILSTGEQGPIEEYWAISNNAAGENNSLISVRLNSGAGEVSGFNNKNIADGKWHQIIFIRDKFTNIVKIYVDGAFENEFYDLTTDIFDVSGSLQLGIGNINQNDWFNGNISDVSIFNRILNEVEINGSYIQNFKA
ncbi:MAG: LamG domain-containing protein [Nanoarchaeota archaeon]